MEITITVSNKTAEIIEHKAKENGKNVDEFLEEFVEENFTDEKVEKRERNHNLLKFAGKFSSGKTDTSERMHEILYSEDLNSAEGFNIK